MNARETYPALAVAEATLASTNNRIAFEYRTALNELDRQSATIVEQLTEIGRFRAHSALLNRIGYKVAVALGKVTPPDDYFGDVVENVNELLRRAGFETLTDAGGDG